MVSFKGKLSLRKKKKNLRIGQGANINNQIKTKARRLFCGRQLTSHAMTFTYDSNGSVGNPWGDYAQATVEKPASERCL